MFSPDQWLASTGVSFYNDVATQSLRFDDGRSAYLSHLFSTPTNQNKWTINVWVKRSHLGTVQRILGTGPYVNTSEFTLFFNSDNTLKVTHYTGGGVTLVNEFITTRLFRDTSAWYNIHHIFDSAGSGDDRQQLWVNGERITSFSGTTVISSESSAYNTVRVHEIGRGNNQQYFDGYMSEINFVDGLALAPSYFGETKNGVWIAKKPVVSSYGVNGFRLQFNQTGTGTASGSTIGADTSGQTNHFTSSGIVAFDCNMPDSPENNFATALGSLSEPLDYQSYYKATYSEGNLKVTGSSSGWSNGSSNFGVTSGKWYAECRINAKAGTGYVRFGMRSRPARTYDEYFWGDDGTGQVDGTSSPYSSRVGTYIAGDILMIALDLDNNALYFGKDGTWENSATSSEIANGTTTNAFVASSTIIPTGADNVGQAYFFYCQPHSTGSNVTWNFGQDSQFANSTLTAGTETPSEGAGVFKYAPPSGFLALCTSNLPEPTISPNDDTQADDYFGTLTYIGNGTDSNSTQNIRVGGTNVVGDIDFKPDWVWIKSKSNSTNHILTDSVRLAGNVLFSNLSNDESDNTAFFTSFETNGFNLAQNGGDTNADGYTYVAWNWKAGGEPSADNSAGAGNTPTANSVKIDGSNLGSALAGTIPATRLSANTTAGFSIVTWTNTSSNNQTIAHGLGVAPTFIITKSRSTNSSAWVIGHSASSFNWTNDYYQFDTGKRRTDGGGTVFGGTPDQNVFTFGTAAGGNGVTFVAYCFAEIEGYSKFGSYTGNGDDDGTFVFTGFRPAWVMFKRTDTTSNWAIFDRNRDPINAGGRELFANEPNLEQSHSEDWDFVSNGIKFRRNYTDNSSGGTFIYMAFAEAPFKYANAE